MAPTHDSIGIFRSFFFGIDKCPRFAGRMWWLAVLIWRVTLTNCNINWNWSRIICGVRCHFWVSDRICVPINVVRLRIRNCVVHFRHIKYGKLSLTLLDRWKITRAKTKTFFIDQWSMIDVLSFDWYYSARRNNCFSVFWSSNNLYCHRSVRSLLSVEIESDDNDWFENDFSVLLSSIQMQPVIVSSLRVYLHEVWIDLVVLCVA